MQLKTQVLETDILIIGGGTAGCFSAITIAEKSDARVIIAEKAHIKRSGCLAAGVNALNAYIHEKESVDSYVDYVKADSQEIIREDLVYTLALRLNEVTHKIEDLGLPILKNDQGKYIARGRRGIKINGENIKPLLAKAVYSHQKITVLNRINIIDYILEGKTVIGAFGFAVEENMFYAIYARAVICTTGGAAGLYRPNNPGFSRHKMWYCPFNTGAGYAMGIRAGAEMTTFEMRFIALRCKDTISPTGTIANGLGARQVNRYGSEYVEDYKDHSTPLRLYATVQESLKGQGPCFLRTKGITEEQETDLYKAYLNMSLAQTLKWIETGKGPSAEDVEIEGTEPYIVGGHTASGYWLDTKRQSTLRGLFAAGDVAGGSPKKYVTGCFAEGQIAAESALEYIKTRKPAVVAMFERRRIRRKKRELNHYFRKKLFAIHSIDEIEDAMQKVMDENAGGISRNYLIDHGKLDFAGQRIDELLELARNLNAEDMHDLLFIYEILDRLYVCKALIHHLKSRKESRWYNYMSSTDYPEKDDGHWLKYVNSVYENGKFRTIFRELTGRTDNYEHCD
ncbi:MAG: adenylyl-sulfate reductase subunit alpha [Thermoclostridium sp.]|nr:adenylyl-sulfate reductase subunit alpha [Thermoclostridium sp.]